MNDNNDTSSLDNAAFATARSSALTRRRLLSLLPLAALAPVAGRAARPGTTQEGGAAAPAAFYPAHVVVDVAKRGPRLSPYLHGIFFEEINHAGDGGLFAELLRTREFTHNSDGWKSCAQSGASATAKVVDGALHVSVDGRGRGGVCHDGYFGIGVKKGARFRLSVDVGGVSFVTAALVAPDGRMLASAPLPAIDAPGPVAVTLTPKSTCPDARLEFTAPAGKSFRVMAPSLMPADAWGTNKSLRRDLAEMIDAIKPSFVRFPGGCFVEGDRLENRFVWKTSLGPREKRASHQNLWGYRCTNGLGYHEYLQWCEDIGAAPLFVVNCGMAHDGVVPMNQMDAVVQDALDAIEYANGDAKTTMWGKRRAAAGHPKSFNLKFVEIGNENGGPVYNERYKLIYDAIKAKFPEITTIACDWGGIPSSAPVEIRDEHYYNSAEFFQREAGRYDSYDRKGPKVYVGEYAVTQGCGQGNLRAALGEAFFITGMERNSDVVVMASYAPLLVNVRDRKWSPDAIVFNTLESYGTPSYWTQRLFSKNRGDVALSTVVETPVAPAATRGAVGVGTWRTDAEFADVKVDGKPIALSPGSGKWAQSGGVWRQSELAEDRRALSAELGRGDYTLTLRARKRGGDEGFLILFRAAAPGDFYWWNLGGWGNTRHNIEHATGGAKSQIARDAPGHIENDRWYSIRIEAMGDRIRCYLDDILIHDVVLPPPPAPLGVVATHDARTGDVLVKMVNLSPSACDAAIDLRNVDGAVTGSGVETTLTSASPDDENSFERPNKIVPIERKVSGLSSRMSRRLPPWSITILRIHVLRPPL